MEELLEAMTDAAGIEQREETLKAAAARPGFQAYVLAFVTFWPFQVP